MNLLLFHGISIPSRIIRRWFFNQPETHAAIEIEPHEERTVTLASGKQVDLKAGNIIEAAWYKSRNADGTVAPRGVRVTSGWTVGHSAKTICDVYQFSGIPHAVMENALRYIVGRVNRAYDLMGLFGFAVRRHVENTEKDFCSELVAAAFKTSGWPLLRSREPYTIPPADLKQSRWVEFLERRMVK